MDSTGRFLLGGALGAVLGYLLSQKGLQKVALPGGELSAGRVALPAAPAGTPAFEADAAQAMAPAAAMVAEAPVIEAPAIRSSFVEAPVIEAPVIEAPVVELSGGEEPYTPIVESSLGPVVEPVPVPWWESKPEPASAYEPARTPVVEMPVVEAPVEPKPVPWWESAAEVPAAEVTEAPTLVVDEAPVAEEAPWAVIKPAVVETPEEAAAPVVSEFEWEPVSWPAPVVEPSEVEAPPVSEPEAAPVMEWEPAPAASAEAPIVELPVDLPEVESAVSIGTEAPVEVKEPVVPTADEAESELVLTRDFLEEPLPGSGWTLAEVPAADEALENFLQVVPDEFPPMPAAEIERSPMDERGERHVPAWSESTVEEPGLVEIEDTYHETSVVELPVVEEVAEAPVLEVLHAEASLAEALPAAATAPVDDLKARIEETRRRIRRELEQPFVAGTEAPEDDWTVSPAIAAPNVPEDLAQDLERDLEQDLAELIEPPAPAVVDLDVDADAEPEEPVDYDSMRSRIEVTRSRLKAKAFDAMMTGESSLLGRDTEDAEHRKKVVPAVDSEVNETIETSLREEEN